MLAYGSSADKPNFDKVTKKYLFATETRWAQKIP